MELATITSVSKQFNISTRTLRYYEEIGLINSTKVSSYAYRMYDDNTIDKISQIIVLRKLSLSLKQINDIFANDDAKYALKVFLQKVDEIDEEIDVLAATKSVIEMLIDKLKHSVNFTIGEHIISDNDVADVLNSISLSSKPLKEKKSMENVKKVRDAKNTIEGVRIVYLPPTAVASAQYEGDEPENHAGKIMDKFVLENKLFEAKKDLRVYGFNNPNPNSKGGNYGYEYWVTVPDDMEIDEPMKKKQFAGGLYAAYCIKMGDFHLWKDFFEWVMKSDEYDYDAREPLSMGGTMEEHLNAYSFYSEYSDDRGFMQLDLLIPIKER